MSEVTVLLTPDEGPRGEPALLDLDVCGTCQLVFFDADELEQMPVQPVRLAPRGPRPPPASRGPEPYRPDPSQLDPVLAYKLDRIKKDADRYDGQMPGGIKRLLAWWVPVEVNEPALRGVPILTYATAALIVLVGMVTLGNLRPAVGGWGFLPSDPMRAGGLTMITSFFLHGGLLHLIGNLYFLVTFGDNVEDFLGAARFAAVLAGSALAGLVLHTLGDPSSTMPLVGASGGISGLMVLYALRFPQARMGLIWYFRWVTMPAWVFMLFWLLMQIVGSLATLGPSGGGVAYLAHLGGAVAGFAAYWFWGRAV